MDKTTTSSFRRGEKLSLRLQYLHNQYQQEDQVWDIGCDHGQLGLSFAEVETVKEIHLVDPSLSVIEVLKQTVKDSYISRPKVFIHHQEGQSVSLSDSSNCIFIAGMGGKEIGDIILHLISKLTPEDRLVISPHRKIMDLRSLLKSLPLGLVKEEVLFEEGQYYQVLILKIDPQLPKVSLYGDGLWQGEWGEKYRQHQLKHFGIHQDVASQAYVEYLKRL